MVVAVGLVQMGNKNNPVVVMEQKRARVKNKLQVVLIITISKKFKPKLKN